MTRLIVLGLAVVVVAAGAVAWTARPFDEVAEQMTGGRVDRGRAAIRQHGCPTCHVIPGIPGAEYHVGPPLSGVASRRYLAGVLPNTPSNLVRWIQAPQDFEPLTAMPDLQVAEEHARDMAAYLYTLR